jgi:hypothetical protein
MLTFFAETAGTATDPLGYYFDKGVLGITIIALIIVIRFMWNYFTKKLDAKDEEIRLLNNARLEDNKIHTVDYREMAKNDQTVLLGNAQAQELLAGKIEAVKGQR